MSTNGLPLVSIIIPTYNAGRTLDKCLRSIEGQDYEGKIETIVVDNLSDDNTKEVAQKFKVRFIEEKCGRSRARNIGAKVARGKYLLFLDSDMYLSKSVVRECVEALEENTRLVALYIPEEIIGGGFWIKVRNFERKFYDMTCIDAVRFIRADVFRKVGGFDEKLVGGEDWDLDRRIKRRGETALIKSPLYHDESKFSISRYLMKKRLYSDTLAKYVAKWGRDDPIVRKQLGLKYRLIGIFLEGGKWKRFIKCPHLSFPMILLRSLVGGIYLITRVAKSKS